jgi:hypothetical protein
MLPIPPLDDSGGAPSPLGPLHLLKMAVGIADLDDLRQVRARRIEQLGGSWVRTRNQPRRAAAVLAGGSLYWVIRGQVRARQRITGFRAEREESGRAFCLIGVDPMVVPTIWRPWRPFQGWRYLAPADAPPDASGGPAAIGLGDEPLPARLLAELRALGLL